MCFGVQDYPRSLKKAQRQKSARQRGRRQNGRGAWLAPGAQPSLYHKLSHPPRGLGRAGSSAVLEGSESPAGEGQLWPSRKPRLKWRRCVGCGMGGPESLPLTGEEELGQTAQCQWAQQHTAPRVHKESGPPPSFRALTLENRESVIRSVPKSQQLTEVLT